MRRTLAERYALVRERIVAACSRVDRHPDSVTLIGVSKRQPVALLQEAYDCGLRLFGESYVQEAVGKVDLMPDDSEWHLIAPLQSNKVKKVVDGGFTCIHAVDRTKIAHRIDREAASIGRRIDVFLEVNLANEASKAGFAPAEIASVAEDVRSLEHLRLRGLMAIPPAQTDVEASRPYFRELRGLVAALGTPPESGWALSMGMSHDFEVAIEEGATHVRVGTAIFGSRST
ncbi:MAG: YggS family pyridoxal phosphate-dependent enzyme [Acidobacteriota bacterium]